MPILSYKLCIRNGKYNFRFENPAQSEVTSSYQIASDGKFLSIIHLLVCHLFCLHFCCCFMCVCAWVFQFTRLNWTEITWHLRMKNKRFGKMCHLKTLFFDIHLKLNHRRLNIHITYSIIYEFSGWFFTFYLENVWQFICIFYAIISF